jgi:hypothetical protein
MKQGNRWKPRIACVSFAQLAHSRRSCNNLLTGFGVKNVRSCLELDLWLGLYIGLEKTFNHNIQCMSREKAPDGVSSGGSGTWDKTSGSRKRFRK